MGEGGSGSGEEGMDGLACVFVCEVGKFVAVSRVTRKGVFFRQEMNEGRKEAREKRGSEEERLWAY